MLTDLQMWEMIAGFVSATFILPVIQQPTWSRRRRAAVGLAWSVVVGLGTAYLSGAFAGVHDVRAAVTGVFTLLVASITSYYGIAKPLGVAPAIERATSPNPLS